MYQNGYEVKRREWQGLDQTEHLFGKRVNSDAGNEREEDGNHDILIKDGD